MDEQQDFETNERLRQERCDLVSALDSSVSSEAGDYHVDRMIAAAMKSDKFWELFGDVEFPYAREEFEQIEANRAAARARIKEIDKILGE